MPETPTETAGGWTPDQLMQPALVMIDPAVVQRMLAVLRSTDTNPKCQIIGWTRHLRKLCCLSRIVHQIFQTLPEKLEKHSRHWINSKSQNHVVSNSGTIPHITQVSITSIRNSPPLKINTRYLEEDIFTAIGGVVAQCKGAYACIAMLAGFRTIAFRDPNGIRPVGMASRKAANGAEGLDYIFSSESVVADACGSTHRLARC